jgi:hypothetical protein
MIRTRSATPNPEPSRELVSLDDVVAALPFICRRDHRIVAGFAKQSAAEEWAQSRSWNDESKFTVHTAAEVINSWQDGKPEHEDDD